MGTKYFACKRFRRHCEIVHQLPDVRRRGSSPCQVTKRNSSRDHCCLHVSSTMSLETQLHLLLVCTFFACLLVSFLSPCMYLFDLLNSGMILRHSTATSPQGQLLWLRGWQNSQQHRPHLVCPNFDVFLLLSVVLIAGGLCAKRQSGPRWHSLGAVCRIFLIQGRSWRPKGYAGAPTMVRRSLGCHCRR